MFFSSMNSFLTKPVFVRIPRPWLYLKIDVEPPNNLIQCLHLQNVLVLSEQLVSVIWFQTREAPAPSASMLRSEPEEEWVIAKGEDRCSADDRNKWRETTNYRQRRISHQALKKQNATFGANILPIDKWQSVTSTTRRMNWQLNWILTMPNTWQTLSACPAPDYDSENWIRCGICLKWSHTLCANFEGEKF